MVDVIFSGEDGLHVDNLTAPEYVEDGYVIGYGIDAQFIPTADALAAAYAILSHHLGGPTVPIVWDAEPWPDAVPKIDARQTGLRVDINKPGTYFITYHRESDLIATSVTGPETHNTVKEQMADIAAMFRTAAASEGELALARFFEYFRENPAVIAERIGLPEIAARIHAWVKED